MNTKVLLCITVVFFSLLRRRNVCNGATLLANCLESDRKSLLYFKDGLIDPENRLSSWKGDDCCRWRGVQCDNRTGAVIAIDLHSSEDISSTGYIRGDIDPALVRLQSLRHLDLSLNSFQDIPIPDFFGSLKELRYLNLSKAGFNGLIPHTLGNISRLQYLDVSSSFSALTVTTLRWVGSLTSLRYLGMNQVDLSRLSMNSLRVLNNLPVLTELHLSGCSLSGSIPSLRPTNLSLLAIVDLSFNSFDSTFPDWITNMSSLVSLDLSYNGLHGNIHYNISELPNLRDLNLAGNENLTADSEELFSGSWRKIKVLNFASNSIYGSLPSSVGNMTSLVNLNLFVNNIQGGIPSSISSLCNLKSLDMSGNNMTGELPMFLVRSNSCITASPLPNLMYLRLSNNKLVGNLPDWLGELDNLEELSLSYNLLHGPIPSSVGRLSRLTDLSLEGNKLSGILPETLGQLLNLVVFDVSFNELSGTVSEPHFSRLRKLKILHISSNSLVLNVSINWIPPFQLKNLDMGSCRLGPSFPAWLKTQREVMYLDFSNASISGTIPTWFWDLSSNLSLLNVSINRLQGQLPNPLKVAPFADVDFSSNLFQGDIPLPVVEIELLDLSNNQFSGSIPPNIGQVLPNLIFFSLSNNHITGQIPVSVGDMLLLQVLDLSENNLTTEIPSSIQYCSYLKVLDLDSNNVYGYIPSSLGQLSQLQTLHLGNNMLSGELPESLRNCSSLETMDLGNNGFIGEIPLWIGEYLSSLKILSLRSNAFLGNLPSQLTNLTSLQVLDLAENKLDGSIPASLADLKAMVRIQNVIQYWFYGKYRGLYYEDSLVVTTKGQRLKYTKTLSLVTSIDLSGNELDGEFPTGITELHGLVVLNLSRNHFTGHIPDAIGDLRQLSSFDISSNQLSGAIPSSLSSLSSLSYLNLSNNDFSGMIPFTGQLTTFNASAFYGNPRLCGTPLPTKCQADDTDNRETIEDDSGNELIDKWFYLSVGLGFAAGLLVPFAILAMKRPWSAAYFGFMDTIIEKLSCMKKTVDIFRRNKHRRRRQK
ncbi:Leucine-rich repeat receptor protein kinase msp1 [Thalictrum thalictroides]|uniref:Leucine-rich repeat receptor protein kinase msp1 n=1 Tax=Thalictrum thalictroides TaxID=46969 RepID=A0A7J6X028_THATH|nr:Leucine-rich repeat receptor protein kinase msp1 [Thalictrum thalictroides]